MLLLFTTIERTITPFPQFSQFFTIGMCNFGKFALVEKLKQSHFSHNAIFYKGTFTNYVDIFYIINIDKKLAFLDYLLPSSCKRPPTLQTFFMDTAVQKVNFVLVQKNLNLLKTFWSTTYTQIFVGPVERPDISCFNHCACCMSV